jgi:tRNA(Ile)-lysidine synthase
LTAPSNIEPITDAELPALFALLEPYETVFLAVSGGADSTAMMHLVKRWWQVTGRDRPEIKVLIVDHGLRPEAKAEAAAVMASATQLGLPAKVLTWTGTVPTTGVQEAARNIRYGLLIGEVAKVQAKAALVVAHHRDDLAETLLMRLARGAGVDGLAAMQPVASRHGVAMIRPLLEMPKSRLKATLRAIGAPWFEDPSNHNANFERTRLRAAADARAKLGLSDDALALTSRRLARARSALDGIVFQLLAPRLEDRLLKKCGLFEWLWPPESIPDEIAVRLLTRILPAIGGTSEPARMVQVEHLYEDMQRSTFRGGTLSNCVIKPAKTGAGVSFQFYREPKRTLLPEMTTDLNQSQIWDNRFEISRCEQAVRPNTVHIRALTRADVKALGIEASDNAFPYPIEALEATPFIEDACGQFWIPALDVHGRDRELQEVSSLQCHFRVEKLR